jgi:glutamate dehydrogenase
MVQNSLTTTRIESVKALAKSTLPSATSLAMFIEQFYRNMDADELAERDLQSLFEAARASWDLLQTSNGIDPAIRIYNPDKQSDKWASNFTIVDLVLPDMPFLVDSIAMAMQRQGLAIHFLLHPLFVTGRAKNGTIENICVPKQANNWKNAKRESVIHVEIDRISDTSQQATVCQELESVLTDVEHAVTDWPLMREKILEIKVQAANAPANIDKRERTEILTFLQWIHDDHLTILGYREYALREVDSNLELHALASSGLGILRCEDAESLSLSFAALPPEIRKLATSKNLLITNKSNSRATIHRPGYMDYIGVKKYDSSGKVIGEHRILGLYTTSAFNTPPKDIPYLRLKVERLLERADLPAKSHRAKLLMDIVGFYPRDELFQISDDDLFRIVTGILHMQERQRVRLFVREDAYRRFVTCLVYVPRERFSTGVRIRILTELKNVFDGSEEPQFNVQIGDSLLARIFAVIRISDYQCDMPDIKELEQSLTLLTWQWKDFLRSALFRAYSESTSLRLFEQYAEAFPVDYQEWNDASTGVDDIQSMESLNDDKPLSIRLYQRKEDMSRSGHFRIKIYNLVAPIVLSDTLPLLENMGLRVINARPYQITKTNQQQAWLLEFQVSTDCTGCLDLDNLSDLVSDTFVATWFGKVENDPFNALAIKASLPSRQVIILRMYSRYLKQVGLPYSQHYIAETLQAKANIASRLVALFEAKFSPDRHSLERMQSIENDIQQALDDVSSLDQDRILRALMGLILCTLRTNCYQDDKSYMSIKLSSRDIEELPEPRPRYEVFVYSPDTEGVHLRAGKVARGGLRWSDRKEDYRTEVLGLVKAQMVKNAVIVPEGSKGGFIVKESLAGLDRATIKEKVLASYKTFIRGLLDITDNLVNNEVKQPDGVIRYDDDDPYLVVAADKGTATFSDIANGVSQAYDFWLSDAFASGGSNGYDHKKMGITARGAWESVKRHFRELGKDIQNEPFTVVGIGDMSGDVFGNGMLLSKQIKLIAAFDHRHIFIDPDPDAAVSYKERQRLFELPGSSWDDYDRSLLSEGGEIYSRSLKSIELSDAAVKVLGLGKNRFTSLTLINALLKAPVELIWNGGIGTYIKASGESHADVGDRHNDNIRISASELRAKVIGEGGNLGVTQMARIEYAKLGGMCNTDSIDNSAGVDCSDHEVNIKILLNATMQSDVLDNVARNKLLREMTDDVAQLVLQHNYTQTQVISLMVDRRQSLFNEHVRYMRALERLGLLKPAIEFLPDEEEQAQRIVDGTGMTRPELCILLAYAKIDVFLQLVRSHLVDEKYFVDDTSHYFPERLRRPFAEQIRQHRLQREIIATKTTNNMLNRMGATFVFRLQELTGAPAYRIVRAFSIIRDSFRLPELWQQVDHLDNQIPTSLQFQLQHRINQLAEHGSLWILRTYRQNESIHTMIRGFRHCIETLNNHFNGFLSESHREQWQLTQQALSAEGVPDSLANSLAALEIDYLFLDIILLANDTGKPLEDCAKIYFSLLDILDTYWLHLEMRRFKAEDNWHAAARSSLEEELYVLERKIACAMIRATEETPFDPFAVTAVWQDKNSNQLSHCKETFGELQSVEPTSLAIFMVAIQQLRSLLHVSSME